MGFHPVGGVWERGEFTTKQMQIKMIEILADMQKSHQMACQSTSTLEIFWGHMLPGWDMSKHGCQD